MRKEHLPLIFTALAAILFVGGSFFAGKMVGAAADDPCDTLSCWEAHYGALAGEDSVAALQDLKKRYGHEGSARTFCHPLLHIIGSAAAKEFGSVTEAYEYGETFCRSGYYHGVLEGVFGEAGGDDLIAHIDDICADVRQYEAYSYNYFSCVHGIGHGLMAYFDHDLFESLRGCDRLTGEWEQLSCSGGVFMENISSDSVEMPSRFLRDDDVLYPCTAVEEKYRAQCYLIQTSHVLRISGNDFEKVFAACAGAPSEYRDECFQSIGRDVSGFANGSVESAAALCAIGERDARTHCFIGGAVDFLQTHGRERARELCAAAADGGELCTRALDEQIQML